VTFPHCIMYTLRELREAKGLTQRQVSRKLKITQGHYCDIEAGRKRPNIDVLHGLAVLYETSMDMIYHAYYRQKLVYNLPDSTLEYGLRKAIEKDIEKINQLNNQ